MPRKSRTHVIAGNSMDLDLTPSHMTKQEFARRLYKLMIGKGWTQSELARRADLTRDAISTYINAKTFPTPISLKKLADALGVEETEILPNGVQSAMQREPEPSISLNVSPAAPHQAWLRVNRLVSTTVAVKVLEMLENDDVANRA